MKFMLFMIVLGVSLSTYAKCTHIGHWGFANEIAFGCFTVTENKVGYKGCYGEGRKDYRWFEYSVIASNDNKIILEQTKSGHHGKASFELGKFVYLELDESCKGMWFRDCKSEVDLMKALIGDGSNYCSKHRAGARPAKALE